MVELDGVHTHGGHDAHGGLESSIILHVVELAALGHNVKVEAWGVVQADELAESISILLVDITRVCESSESQVEGVLTIVLPDTLEVWLGADAWCLLVWENEVLLLDELWSEFSKGVPFGLEGFTTFLGGGIDTEVDILVLVSMSEGVESAVLFTIVTTLLEHVTTIAPP